MHQASDLPGAARSKLPASGGEVASRRVGERVLMFGGYARRTSSKTRA